MKRVLITGGAGFIAHHLIGQILKTTDWEIISLDRFIDKVTQQYARMTIHNTIKEEGFQVEEEWEMDNNSIELTVSRWV